MKKIGIYMIKNIINNKIYIGQSLDILGRWKAHLNCLKNNKHVNKKLQNAWNKYGESNFIFEIIEECLKEEIYDKEIFYIEKYNSYKTGYNQTLGGDGTYGFFLSEEHKNKIRKANTGRQFTEQQRYNMGNSNRGKKFSEEHKNKISLSEKGKITNQETKEKISKSKLGTAPWNKGKSNVYSEQVRQQISNSLKRTTIEQENEIEKLLLSNIKICKIEKMLGVPRASIYRIIKERKIPYKKRIINKKEK